jgi:hypothetical protein
MSGSICAKQPVEDSASNTEKAENKISRLPSLVFFARTDRWHGELSPISRSVANPKGSCLPKFALEKTEALETEEAVLFPEVSIFCHQF